MMASVKGFVKSGNPWRDVRTGMFIDAPPGVSLMGSTLDVLKELEPQDKRAIDNYLKKVSGHTLAVNSSGDSQISVGIVGSDGAVGFRLEKGKGEQGVSDIKMDDKSGAQNSDENITLPVVDDTNISDDDVEKVPTTDELDKIVVPDIDESVKEALDEIGLSGQEMRNSIKELEDFDISDSDKAAIVSIANAVDGDVNNIAESYNDFIKGLSDLDSSSQKLAKELGAIAKPFLKFIGVDTKIGDRYLRAVKYLMKSKKR